jgi:hypothetical protein
MQPAGLPDGDGTPAWRMRPFSIALGLPMLGFSYSRLTTSEIRLDPTGAAELDRQDRTRNATGRLLRADRVDVTLTQSLGDFIVAGATVGVVRGATALTRVNSGESPGEALDRIADLPADAHTRFEAHVGALAFAGPVRVGVVVRNLTSPTFTDGAGGEVEIPTQVRVGVAWGGGAPAYQRRPWVVDVDADLTRIQASDGERRSVAAGGERWWGRGRAALRAGARLQTVGDIRAQAAVGGSVAVRSGVLIEAAVTGGADRAASGWSMGARVTF